MRITESNQLFGAFGDRLENKPVFAKRKKNGIVNEEYLSYICLNKSGIRKKTMLNVVNVLLAWLAQNLVWPGASCVGVLGAALEVGFEFQNFN